MPELVPRVVLDMVARGEARRSWRALALFADVSGFTAMTERLSGLGAEGAELLADALRAYFDPMLTLVQEASGLVTGFAGDAFTSLFPDDGGSASVDGALLAAASMRDFFAENPVRRTRYGDFAFGLKLGLCADEVSCEVVRGASGRFVWYFRGPAIDRSAAAEHGAGRGEVVLAPEVAARAQGWSVGEGARVLGATRGEGRGFPDGAPSAGLRGEVLFLPKSALGFPPEGEFRDVVSVFFSFDERCDPAALGPLIADELLRFGDGALRVEFGDKGGVAWTFFGAPVTFEDQCDRALFFARSVVAKAGPGVKAGVTRGGVYAGFLGGRSRAEFTCLGRSVNLAARLMARAERGEVWCSQAVRERSRLHGFDSRGASQLKGFERPIEAFAAAALGAAAPPPPSAMVARDGELLALEGLVAAALGAGKPGVVYLDGDAGVGKTALLSSLRGRLLSGADAPLVLWGTCSALKGPLSPLREALWGSRDVVGERPDEEVVGALSMLSSWGPVALILDDASQIDPASVEALKRLLSLPSGSLAVVLSARLDDRGRFFRPDLGEGGALELLPFDDEQLGRLLELMLGQRPPPHQIELISHATGGNPLLACELCASLRQRPPGEPLRLLPDEVTPMLVSRLDRLSVNVRRTVQIAAAFGPTLRFQSLLSLMSRQPRVFDYVRLAEKARVWSLQGDGVVVFRSGMLRDAAAQMLPRERLRRLLRAAFEIESGAGHHREASYTLDQLAQLLPPGVERERVEAERAALAEELGLTGGGGS